MTTVPHRQELMAPTLKALEALGGSGSTEEIREKVIDLMMIPDEVANLPYVSRKGNADGRTSLEYNLAWVRTYLSQLGYIENSSRGVWMLTVSGSDPNVIVGMQGVTGTNAIADQGEQASDWKQDLLKLICERLAPAAFERLVQRILRESGFVQVEVTGRTGDGGIDGRGIAKINGILSFHVVFQCKRYTGSVGAAEIRAFQGAMQGRADKGLFITTGYFTREALREAVRDGASSVDLVDGEKLTEKLKNLGLGVKVECVEHVSLDSDWFNHI